MLPLHKFAQFRRTRPALKDIPDIRSARARELIALDDALKALAAFDEQKARMVELRYFGGLSIEETADVLGVTPTTIKRHWRIAKAWLHGEMQRDA